MSTTLATRALVVVLGIGTFALVAAAQTGRRAPVPMSEEEAVADFQKALEAYVQLRTRAKQGIKEPPTDATPQQIDDNQRLSSQAIVKARAGVKPGAIFRPDIQIYIRARLKQVFSRRDGRDVRASILDENPIGTPVRINGPYPDEIPLASMPPQLLEALPKLPQDLEYRFVGDRLILFDNHAHLILDYMDQALPRV